MLSSSSLNSTSSSLNASKTTSQLVTKGRLCHNKKSGYTSRRFKVSTPSSHSSYASTTATPESSSSEYENCSYVTKTRHLNAAIYMHPNDSADDSISSIEASNSMITEGINSCRQKNSCKHCMLNSRCVTSKLHTNGVTWTSSTPVMQQMASSDVFQNCAISEEQYAYSICSTNRLKSAGNEQVYAYENFDCINECLEETCPNSEHQSHVNDTNDKNKVKF